MNLRFKAFIAAIALLATAGYAISQSSQTVSVLSTDQVQIYGRSTGIPVYVTASGIANFARGSQLLNSTTASVTSAATTVEQTLASFTIPGGTLSALEGNKLKLHTAFTASSTADVKTFTCYYGAASVTVATRLNAGSGYCDWTVTKISNGNELFYGQITLPSAATPITTHTVYATETDSGNVTAKFTFTSGTNASNEATLDDFWIERIGN